MVAVVVEVNVIVVVVSEAERKRSADLFSLVGSPPDGPGKNQWHWEA